MEELEQPLRERLWLLLGHEVPRFLDDEPLDIVGDLAQR
jgi:hypothetical protein